MAKKTPAKRSTAKKKSTIKPTKRITSLALEIDDEEPEEIPARVMNRMLLERLIQMEKKLVRIEKLVLLSVDDNFLIREERERVRKIEQMVADGRIDELEEMMN